MKKLTFAIQNIKYSSYDAFIMNNNLKKNLSFFIRKLLIVSKME